MVSTTNGLSSLTSGLRSVRVERERYSEKLASGGTEALWSDKTAAQIDISITTTNQIQRLEGFEQGNKLVESRLRSQLLVLDDFMKLVREIHTEFMPGRYTMGGVRPGLVATQQNAIDRFIRIGNRVDFVSGEYALGGIATQNAPIKAQADWNGLTAPGTGGGGAVGGGQVATDYSNPVAGSITVYINDMGDTISLSGNDFDTEIVGVFTTILQLCNSANGSDAASEEASVSASDAHKALLAKYYQKLDQLNAIMAQDDELSVAIQKAIELREEVTTDSIESLLSQVTTLSVMEDIRQHLITQENRKAQSAAEMLRQR